MLTITLGTQASGSTWLFNVALQLYRAAGHHPYNIYSDDGLEALDRMPVRVDRVLLKSHGLDQRLLRIAQLAKARIIVSTRDPRDSAVSQIERFSYSLHHAASNLSRSLSTIWSLPDELTTLHFAYEDRFMEKRSTIEAVADFLELPITAPAMVEIYDSLTAAAVRARISDRLEAVPAGQDVPHDHETHWLPNHVGDGKSGKWRERLGADDGRIVDGCLTPLAAFGRWREQALLWSAELFEFADEKSGPTVELTATQDAAFLAWGPYLHLPPGRWRAIPRLRKAPHSSDALLEVDVYQHCVDRMLARAIGRVQHRDAPELVVDFEHHDHFQSLEIRLRSCPDAPCKVTFGGWRVFWLGEL